MSEPATKKELRLMQARKLRAMDAVEFVKYLNSRTGWHGNQYRSTCGRWLHEHNQSTNRKLDTDEL